MLWRGNKKTKCRLMGKSKQMEYKKNDSVRMVEKQYLCALVLSGERNRSKQNKERRRKKKCSCEKIKEEQRTRKC